MPKHWEDEVQTQLEYMKRGVINPIPAGEPTEWFGQMVLMVKKSDQPHRTVDYQRLNTTCLRETQHTSAPFDVVFGVPKHSLKTLADAHWGRDQVELDQEG